MGLGWKEIVTFGNDEVKVPSLSTLDSTTLRPINTQNDSPEKGKKETKKEIKKEEKETKKEEKQKWKEIKKEIKQEEKQEERIENRIDIRTITSENFIKRISKLNDLELTSFYKLISENSYNNWYSVFIRKLSQNQRMLILDNLSKSANLRNAVKLEDKINLRNNILPENEDRKKRLTNLVLSPRDKWLTPEQAKNRIENFFLVSEIVWWFWYDRSKSAPVFFKKAFPTETYLKDNSQEAVNQAVKLWWWFISKMLETKEGWDNILKKSFIKDKQLNFIKSHIQDEWRIIWVVEWLSMLDDEQQRIVNGLSKDALISFLNSIIGYENPQKTWDYSFDSAEGINMMLTFANNKDNITSLLQNVGEKWLISATSELRQATEASIKASWKKIEESDSSEIASIQTKLIYEKAKSRAQENKWDKWNWMNQIQRDFEIDKELKVVWNEMLMSDDLSTKQKQELKDLSKKTFDKNNQDLLISAQKYGFTEDLRQVRWEKYYEEVEQQYLSTIKNTTKNELETYQKTEAGKEIQNLFSPDWLYFKQIFSGQKLIKEEDIRWNLWEQEYAKALERIYSDKQENKLDDSLQNHWERLSTNVDDTTKNAFMQNVSYFLQNVLDIQLDKEGQENILKNLSINQENFATSKSQEIQISWIDKNNPIKKYDFTYNIVTWEFKTNKLMDIQQWDKYASLNQITPLTEIRWPKFGEFFDNAKVISHQVLRDEKVNSEQNFLKEFDTRLTLSTKIPKQSDKAKEQMKLFCLKNVLTQEILDMMKIQNDQVKNDEELFPLLARSINSYSSEELTTTRSIIKSMRDFYEIQEQIKNISNLSELEREAAIDSNIADLSKKVDGEEVYKEISSKTFYLIRAIETDPKDTIKNFSLFFKSFLGDKKDNWNDIISPKKLISYKQDLEKPNAINDSSYLAQFEQNMSTFEDQALDQKISHQNLA